MIVAQPVDNAARTLRSPRSRRVLAVIGIVAVIAVAVGVFVLVWPTPPGAVVLHTGTSRYVVTATVGSPRIGTSTVEIDLTGRAGTPPRPTAVELAAVMPLMGYATPPVMATSVGAGRYRAAGVPLMMTGPWELLLSIDFSGGVDHLMLPLTVSG